MSARRPRATLQIIRQPHIAPGAKCFEVDCKFGTTSITHLPGPVELGDKLLITAVGFEHEARCGDCDLTDVFAKGDRQMEQLTNELWPRIVGAMVSRGRRN